MPGGFGGPGGVFSNNRNSGKATTATTTKKTPPGPPKPPGNLARVKNPTRAISGAVSLIKCRDYRCLITGIWRPAIGATFCIESVFEVGNTRIPYLDIRKYERRTHRT